MTDSPAASVLQEIVRRQSRSLLSYVGESFPWTNSEAREGLRQFRRIFEEDRRATGVLIRLLERRKASLPYFGAFPAWFTTINFVSLDYLLPRLVEAQRQEVAQLERDLELLTEEDVRVAVRDNLDAKRRHLQELEALAVARTAPAAVTA